MYFGKREKEWDVSYNSRNPEQTKDLAWWFLVGE